MKAPKTYPTVTKEDIQFRNEAIAIYMGYKFFAWNSPDNQLKIGGYWAKANAKIHHLKVKDNVLQCNFRRLEYRDNMEWMIPVMQKIEKEGCIVKFSLCIGAYCEVFKSNGTFKLSQKWSHESNDPKEAIFVAISNYCIDKNNEQPKN